ncbi:hypothetical protein Hanom_Chr06g00539721 [Helianthus anomalus]
MDILDEVGSGCRVGLDDPVSIWTTCLKEVVSAWMKVVGGSDLEAGLGGVWVGLLAVVLQPSLEEEFAGESCSVEMISIRGVVNMDFW